MIDMKNLEPILKKEGVFYENTQDQPTKCTIILEEITEKAKFVIEHLNNQGKIFGIRAYHKLTGDSCYYSAKISKKIGNPKIHIILDDAVPINYAKTLREAFFKAHEYVLNKAIEEAMSLESEVYSNLLDTTKVGKENYEHDRQTW